MTEKLGTNWLKIFFEIGEIQMDRQFLRLKIPTLIPTYIINYVA